MALRQLDIQMQWNKVGLPPSFHTQKLVQIGSKNLYFRTKMLTLLEENIVVNLHGLGFGNRL